MQYTALNCTVLHCAALPYQYPITITFAFVSQFLLYLNYTKVLYNVVLSFFIIKTFAFTKQTCAQTNNNIYIFILFELMNLFTSFNFGNSLSFAIKYTLTKGRLQLKIPSSFYY